MIVKFSNALKILSVISEGIFNVIRALDRKLSEYSPIMYISISLVYFNFVLTRGYTELFGLSAICIELNIRFIV